MKKLVFAAKERTENRDRGMVIDHVETIIDEVFEAFGIEVVSYRVGYDKVFVDKVKVYDRLVDAHMADAGTEIDSTLSAESYRSSRSFQVLLRHIYVSAVDDSELDEVRREVDKAVLSKSNTSFDDESFFEADYSTGFTYQPSPRAYVDNPCITIYPEYFYVYLEGSQDDDSKISVSAPIDLTFEDARKLLNNELTYSDISIKVEDALHNAYEQAKDEFASRQKQKLRDDAANDVRQDLQLYLTDRLPEYDISVTIPSYWTILINYVLEGVSYEMYIQDSAYDVPDTDSSDYQNWLKTVYTKVRRNIAKRKKSIQGE